MLLVWISVALLVGALAFGAWRTFTGVREVLRALRALGGGVGDAMARVAESADRLDEAAARLPAGGERLAATLSRFARTGGEFAVLTAAMSETAALGRSVRGVVPRK